MRVQFGSWFKVFVYPVSWRWSLGIWSWFRWDYLLLWNMVLPWWWMPWTWSLDLLLVVIDGCSQDHGGCGQGYKDQDPEHHQGLGVHAPTSLPSVPGNMGLYEDWDTRVALHLHNG